MIQYELFTKENAPEGAKNGLVEIEKKVGFVPNLQRVMAQAPALLDGYLSLWRLFENTSLTPAEQQVVLITTSVENGCTLLCRRVYRVGASGRVVTVQS